MGRQAVDLAPALPKGAPQVAETHRAAQLSAWLRKARVPLRSIRLHAYGWYTDSKFAAQRLAVSKHMLPASQTTLEVLSALREVAASIAVNCTRCHRLRPLAPELSNRAGVATSSHTDCSRTRRR